MDHLTEILKCFILWFIIQCLFGDVHFDNIQIIEMRAIHKLQIQGEKPSSNDLLRHLNV